MARRCQWADVQGSKKSKTETRRRERFANSVAGTVGESPAQSAHKSSTGLFSEAEPLGLIMDVMLTKGHASARFAPNLLRGRVRFF